MALSFIENYITVYKNFFYKPAESSTSSIAIREPSYSIFFDRVEIHYGGNVNIQLGNDTLIKTHIINNHIKKGFFGLAYYSIDHNHHPCLIEHLFKLANDKKVFYLNTKENKLIIGSYPKGYEQYQLNINKEVKYCKLEEKQYERGYACILDSMYYRDNKGFYKMYEVDDYMWFSASSNMIYVPLQFLDELIENFFYSKAFHDKCKRVALEFSLFVICRDDVKAETVLMSPITLVIGNRSLRFNRDDLFNIISNQKYFIFGYNYSQIFWTFGYPFLSKFNVVFDIEQHIAVFANDK